MMQSFRFYCQACETPPQAITCVGGDDDLNLIVGWHCHVCNKPVLAKSPISYLFDLTVELDDDDEEPPADAFGVLGRDGTSSLGGCGLPRSR